MPRIYLAGNVPKGKEESENFENWRLRYAKALKEFFPYDCIDPFERHVDEADYQALFGSDCEHIKNCAFVVVNAENRLGVGTSQEMVIAKYFKKMVVTVLPKGSYHRRDNIEINEQVLKEWISPFIVAFSDFIIEDINDVARIHQDVLSSKPKDLSIIDKAVTEFEKNG